MNVVKWNEIYQNNKKLDKMFQEKYCNDHELYEKNVIEFLVELGEFVNETKVFKYWTIKKPDKEKMLEEYADTITMCLTFMREFQISEIKDSYEHENTKDIICLIDYLYVLIANLYDKPFDIQRIFGNLLYLGELLKLDEDEVIKAINKKHKIIKNRLESDY